MGIRLRRYLDDWLIQSPSREAVLRDRRVVLNLCQELGIVVNPMKSNFVPSQRVLYLGTILDSRSFVASPSPDRIARLLSLGDKFLSSVRQPASCWQSLLGTLSSLSHLVLGGRLRMWSLQFQLHRSWDRLDDSALFAWTPPCRFDLLWWLDESRLCRGFSRPALSGPRLLVRRLGRGLGCSPGSRRGFRPLVSRRGVCFHQRVGAYGGEKGLLHFQSSLVGSTVAVFVDNSTAVAYLRKSWGTLSLLLNEIAQRILRWSELRVTLAPQFIPGCRNVLSDSLSPHQILGSEWTLHADMFRDLCRQWPVMVDLFATSANHRCSVYFPPFRDPQSAGTDAFLQSWDGLLAYAFPPWSVIPQVLAKLCASRGTYLTLVAPYWPQRPWFPELLDLAVAPPVVLPSRPDLLFQPQSGLCYPGLLRLRLHARETLQRFTRAAGFSFGVASQVGLARRTSSRTNCQLKWSTYRSWCCAKGHSISRPSFSKVADFLLWLRHHKGLRVSSVMGYRSMLSTVFCFQLPGLSSPPVLRDLLRSFRLEALRPPAWDLAAVLTFLNCCV